MRKGLLTAFAFTLSAVCATHGVAAERYADDVRSNGEKGLKTKVGTSRYIVLLDDPTLMDEWRRLEAQVGNAQMPLARAGRPDLRSDLARNQLQRIDARFEDFEQVFEAEFGRPLQPVHRYRVALNGFSVRLDNEEARRLLDLDRVRAVMPDEDYKLETFAGPEWIGADDIWRGEGFLSENRGEGIVLGIIDSGINWEHPSFSDPGDGLPIEDPNAYDHENPYGQFLGLCAESDPVPQCNDKLVGVYDFVEDNPDTEVVEEFNDGADNGAHGAHTAGTAGGNPVSITFAGNSPEQLTGVAPNANVISYRVCFAGDPDDSEDDACQGSAILAAIDQAIADGVDVINYSIGGGAFDPWAAPDTIAFLEAYEAGIFVATSAGNAGPGVGTVGRPANAPWITAVGSATHDKVFAGQLITASGGATAPPGILIGKTLTQESLSEAPIVYAGDFGNALCGTGTPELQPDCDSNTGASSPFEPGTFDGQIVVCDRGTYGRIEKGKNVLLAGAAGYVLANTDETGGQSTVEDQHCLPSTHLRATEGNLLRDWLAGGENHRASLSGSSLASDPAEADRMSGFSSRGPTPAPAEDILKPNLIAPGDLIFAAGTEGNQVIGLGGTSMASPHVAGAAALLLAQEPDLTPGQVASMLELTATDEIAKDEGFGPADHFDTGAGRPRLFEAATVGVYLDESGANFRAADPFDGGEPRDLNLASLTDLGCERSCTFTRRIGAFDGGRTWTLSSSGFPEGVEVTLSPESFTIPQGGTQEITVTIDWEGAPDVSNDFFFGKIHIDNPSFPTATMPASIFASLGAFPEEFIVRTNQSAGTQVFAVPGIDDIPQVNLLSGGFQEAERTTVPLTEDPTFSDPYDTDEGAITLLFDVPPNALFFHSDTPASASEDVDLYVGYDANGDGRAERSEEVCFSATFSDVEFCDIINPQAGVWWVRIQNFEDGLDVVDGPAQDITLVSAVIAEDPEGTLIATGPGITELFVENRLRLSWNDIGQPDGIFYGAVGVGSGAGTGADLAVIPVRLERVGVGTPVTAALVDGADREFALRGRETHESLFIDVPPGTQSLDIQVAGASILENESLQLDLVRVPFDGAFTAAPRTVLPGSATTVASDTGASGQGPSVSVSGGLQPGRYHAVIENLGVSDLSVRVRAELQSDGTAFDVFGGLWEPASRPGINQGFEYTPAGGNRAFLWYTYDDDGSPAWYIAAGPESEGNRWQADLFRFTNDGETQRGTRVGEIAISLLGESDAVMTWNLYGQSGSDRVTPLSRTCPNNENESFTGLWYRGTDGVGGASVIANVASQAHIHYLYDASGEPRWLLGAGGFSDNQLPLSQFSGFCPNCTGSVSSTTVGTLGISYADNAAGSWTLDYEFQSPARGSTQRIDDIVKLSNELACEG